MQNITAPARTCVIVSSIIFSCDHEALFSCEHKLISWSLWETCFQLIIFSSGLSQQNWYRVCRYFIRHEINKKIHVYKKKTLCQYWLELESCIDLSMRLINLMTERKLAAFFSKQRCQMFTVGWSKEAKCWPHFGLWEIMGIFHNVFDIIQTKRLMD